MYPSKPTLAEISVTIESTPRSRLLKRESLNTHGLQPEFEGKASLILLVRICWPTKVWSLHSTSVHGYLNLLVSMARTCPRLLQAENSSDRLHCELQFLTNTRSALSGLKV